jgi:hypothetical protein
MLIGHQQTPPLPIVFVGWQYKVTSRKGALHTALSDLHSQPANLPICPPETGKPTLPSQLSLRGEYISTLASDLFGIEQLTCISELWVLSHLCCKGLYCESKEWNQQKRNANDEPQTAQKEWPSLL